MASMAGQPEYVGVMVTWTAGTIPPSSVLGSVETWTSRRMPRSAMVRTGISGSHTVAATAQAFSRAVLPLAALRRSAVSGSETNISMVLYQLAPGYSRASTCISARM